MSNTTPAYEQRTVGFLDVLGFSELVRHDFDQALKVYEQIVSLVRERDQDERRRAHLMELRGKRLEDALPELDLESPVTFQIWSDAVVLVSASLVQVIKHAREFQTAALELGYLVRGGIASGEHVELERGQVVSRALTKAVELEKRADVPRILLHKEIAADWPEPLLRLGGLLAIDGDVTINPLNRATNMDACRRGLDLAESRAPSVRGKAKALWLRWLIEDQAPGYREVQRKHQEQMRAFAEVKEKLRREQRARSAKVGLGSA